MSFLSEKGKPLFFQAVGFFGAIFLRGVRSSSSFLFLSLTLLLERFFSSSKRVERGWAKELTGCRFPLKIRVTSCLSGNTSCIKTAKTGAVADRQTESNNVMEP